MGTIWLGGVLLAGDVITMPLPAGHGQPPEVSIVANRMVLAISGVGSPSGSLFNDGLDSLQRYSSRDGQTRNHYNSTGYVPRASFMNEYSTPFYSSYRGPRGWGWYGSPIIVNNYCPTFNGGGVLPSRTRSSFLGMRSF